MHKFSGDQARLEERLHRGEEGALAECYARFGPMVRRYARWWVPADAADDVAQAVFVELWRCRGAYDPGLSLEAWLMGITRKRAIDQLRAESRHSRRKVPLVERDGAFDGTSAVELARDVRCALARLPRPQREAIELAHFGQLTQREIAARLDVPLGTVKARTARGLRKLGELL
ncbi:sigma-70 family RNA polymerase sigma factor [Actinocorallia longicatena]|uniref:RNA polymerase sigma-70 factor (ECF subfamily) n=1 Tax=Actinocorallia longicatena TaxID=111803 RepID=A0ABP6QC60_9ACTN